MNEKSETPAANETTDTTNTSKGTDTTDATNGADSTDNAGPADAATAESAEAADTAFSQPVSGGRRISIAIVAMGGQGGGVLADWFIALAEANGWLVQNTSVPGVAQRTGATIYYVELFERAAGQQAEPVLALMPGSGDVDLVIAAEWMEAGRAIMRGLVTPDRTTLVASTHRAFATVEKMVPGNGMADPQAVFDAARIAARKLIAFDMAAIASKNNTVISATLFGAVAASEALPFELSSYEAAITAGGVGVDSSLAGLRAAYEAARAADSPAKDRDDETTDSDAAPLQLPDGPIGQRLAALPKAVQRFALEGARRCVEYLDTDYAGEYLDRLESMAASQPDENLNAEFARWLALRMCYEDPVRVADLKIRASRFASIREEVGAGQKQVVHHTEFMHPRLEEIVDTLPRHWAEKLQRNTFVRDRVVAWFGRGLLFRTSTLRGFLSVWILSRMSGWRRQSLRHARETEQINEWAARIEQLGRDNPSLGCAVAKAARLIKGYGDSHARGSALYQRILGIAGGLAGRPDAGAIIDYLIDAALADANGTEFEKAVTELNEHTSSQEAARQAQPTAAGAG